MQVTGYLKMVASSVHGLLESFHVEQQYASRVVNKHRPVSTVADQHLSSSVSTDPPRRRQVRSEAGHELAGCAEYLDVLGTAIADHVAPGAGRRSTALGRHCRTLLPQYCHVPRVDESPTTFRTDLELQLAAVVEHFHLLVDVVHDRDQRRSVGRIFVAGRHRHGSRFAALAVGRDPSWERRQQDWFLDYGAGVG